MEVNRCLDDPEMDRIDHALGRPVDPLGETSRNGFVTEPGDPEALEMSASPYWTNGIRWMGTTEAFRVTTAGREALAAHLREIGDRTRNFQVTFRGHPRTIAAKSPSQARYRRFLEMDGSEISFRDYCRDTRVRLAR